MIVEGVAGTVAVVIGGGGALGGASARLLAANGARVVIVGRTAASLTRTAEKIRDGGGDVVDVVADASDEHDIENVFNECYRHFGPCEVLVHAAAIQGPTSPLTEVALDDWREVVRVNLDSVFLSARAALAQMLPRQNGSIILVSSADALRGFPMTGPYAATKSALTGFARALAAETRGQGVRVNVLSPGPMPEAAIFKTAVKGIGDRLGIAPEDVLAAGSGAQRSFDAKDVAKGVLFLAGPDSRIMTGQSLVMDSMLTQV